MKTKVLATSCLGMLLGYLSGYNLAYSASLIKLSILIFFINLFFIKKAKQDILFRKILILITVFILFFIISSIRGNILKKDFLNVKEKVYLEVKVYDVLVKDSIQILKAEIINIPKETKLEDETSELNSVSSQGSEESKGIDFIKSNLISRNVAIYTFSQEKYTPGVYLTLNGSVQNELIVLPKKESETYFNQNNGNSFDLLKYWNTRNISFVSSFPKLSILEKEKVIKLSKERTPVKIMQDNLYFYSYQFRNYFSAALKKTLDNFDSGIVMAMLWGDENNISKDTNNIFKNIGTSHILVLSGYNLITVAAAVSFVFRKFSLKKKVMLSLFFIILFLLLAHTSIPAWRASIMSLYTMLAIFFLKEANARFSLWLTCFIFMVYSPTISMYDVSFHLSFLATLGIIYFYFELEVLVKNKLFTKIKTTQDVKDVDSQENKKIFDSEKYKKWESIISTILVTVSANILIAPYIIFQFGYFKFSSILFSIFVTPFVTLIMLLGFFIGGINGFVNLLLSFNVYIVNIFSKIILLITKILSFILENIIGFIFSVLKTFSESSATISNGISFLSLFILYLFIILFYAYLKFINKNR